MGFYCKSYLFLAEQGRTVNHKTGYKNRYLNRLPASLNIVTAQE